MTTQPQDVEEDVPVIATGKITHRLLITVICRLRFSTYRCGNCKDVSIFNSTF